jgi:hypothetical protein
MNIGGPSGKQHSVMKHDFSRVPHIDIERSSFDRSHGYKTTLDSGYLIPMFVDEVLPGDTFNLKTHLFGRLSTPINPFMDNLHLDTFYFFVPNRLLWDNWEKFNGEQDNPGDSTDFLVPKVNTPSGGHSNETLYDYFGIPTNEDIESVNNLHGRAYNLIYNEWFRDQNLIDSVKIDKGDGPDDPADYVLRRRGKRHDYFTSCLPWPQKGDAVSIPLTGNAPITGLGKINQSYTEVNRTAYETSRTSTVTYANSSVIDGGSPNTGVLVEEDPNNSGFPAIFADLSDVAAATINDLRQAFQIQRLLEKDARGGTRYTEIIKSHFGVTSPDARLQRPEYLGGGSTPIYIDPVPQTGSTDATTPQGNLAAYGTVQDSHHGFNKSFTEHGVLIGLVSIRADLTYQQGLNRMWSRSGRYDFYWPSLSHLGEQAVLSKEIYADGSVSDQDVFGYQERYAEYRYKPSMITGKFRSNDPQSLHNWHLSQDFSARPVLNEAFIQDDPPVDRVLAVQDEPQFLLDIYFKLHCARPMPMYSVPGLIDHF